MIHTISPALRWRGNHASRTQAGITLNRDSDNNPHAMICWTQTSTDTIKIQKPGEIRKFYERTSTLGYYDHSPPRPARKTIIPMVWSFCHSKHGQTRGIQAAQWRSQNKPQVERGQPLPLLSLANSIPTFALVWVVIFHLFCYYDSARGFVLLFRTGEACKKVWGFLMRRTCVPLWQFKLTLFPNSDLRCKNVETRPAGARSRLSMEFLANKVASFNHWWNSAVTNSATSNGLRTGQALRLSKKWEIEEDKPKGTTNVLPLQ